MSASLKAGMLVRARGAGANLHANDYSRAKGHVGMVNGGMVFFVLKSGLIGRMAYKAAEADFSAGFIEDSGSRATGAETSFQRHFMDSLPKI